MEQPTTPRLFVDGAEVRCYTLASYLDGAEVQCQTLDTHRNDPHGVAFYSIDGGDWFAATTNCLTKRGSVPANNGTEIEWLEIYLTKT